jgi:hypothetical protein
MSSTAPSASPVLAEPVGLLPRLMLPTLFILQVVMGVAQLFHPHIDVDTWWHLRVGEWIVEHRRIPTTDPFSRYGLESGKPWLAYSWLYELVLYGCYRQWDWNGVVLFRAVQSFAVGYAWFLFTTRQSTSVAWTALLFFVGYVSFFLMTLSERPWLLSMMLAMWTLAVIQDGRRGEGRWHHWLLPLGYVLWANWHIQFIYGLALLGLGVVAPLLDRLLGLEDDSATPWGSAGWRRLTLLVGLCVAGTLLNPFHVWIYYVVLDYASQPGAFAYVYELMAPNFRRREDWLCVALAGLALFLAGRQSRLSTFHLLLILGPTFAGLRAKRDEWYLLLGVIAVLSQWRFPWLSLPPAPAWPRWTRLVLPLMLLSLAVVGSLRIPAASFAADEAEHYPAAAVAHIREQRYPGPLFNHFDWGGYLIWRLRDYPVAMDGRTNLHGDARIEAAIQTWCGKPGWDELPELRAARLLLIQQDSPLGQLLRRDARFRLVFEEKRAAVFVAVP